MQENSIITLNGAFACEFIISSEFGDYTKKDHKWCPQF